LEDNVNIRKHRVSRSDSQIAVCLVSPSEGQIKPNANPGNPDTNTNHNPITNPNLT